MIFSTDCSQSMGLQSVLKVRVKTSKLFALQAPPYEGSKPRVNLDAFIFSTSTIVAKNVRSCEFAIRSSRASELIYEGRVVKIVV